MAKVEGDDARPRKRSLVVSGHRTSVTLEEPFWRELRRAAERRGLSLNALAGRIDADRAPEVGLASALRVFILREALGAGAAEDQPMVPSAGNASSSQ